MQAQGWMDDLQVYVLINSISVISGRWAPLIMKGCVQWTPFMVERGIVDESSHQDLRCFSQLFSSLVLKELKIYSP